MFNIFKKKEKRDKKIFSEPKVSEIKKESIFSQSWFVIVSLIVFFPLGIFLMWKYSKFGIITRIIISLAIVVFVIPTLFNTTQNNKETSETFVLESESRSNSININATKKSNDPIENKTYKSKKVKEETKEEIIENIDVKAAVSGYRDSGDYYTKFYKYCFDFGHNVKIIVEGNTIPKSSRRRISKVSTVKFSGNYIDGWEDEYDYFKVNEDNKIERTSKKYGETEICTEFNAESENEWIKDYMSKKDMWNLKEYFFIE